MAINRSHLLILVLAALVCEAVANQLVDSMCGITQYKDECIKNLGPAVGDSSDPKDVLKAAFKVAKEKVTKGLQESKTIKEAKQDNKTAEALDICQQVMEYAVSDLERLVNSSDHFDMNNMDGFIEDLRIWIGGTITYQEACFDAFENTTTDAGKKIRQVFNLSRDLTSNALNMVSDLKEMVSKIDVKGITDQISSLLGRRLLEAKKVGWVAGQPPAWVNNPKRKVMNVPLNEIKPDVTVALDGSGQHAKISEAVHKAPKKSMEPFIIKIKAGVYKEHVLIPKDHWNIIFVGDGMDKTIITGDKSFKKGINTFNTATVGVDGEGFMARDIKFENTAGPDGEQAVAIRVASDFAVFYHCWFEASQDTLYSMRGRQFYRDCTIAGTVDFIFGDAQAVYQNCRILINKPRMHQDCEVTAQGRTEPNGPGGFVIQGSRIEATEGYKTFKNSAGKSSYLGRPWKQYSRTIIMNSFIDGVISPEGWHPWPGTGFDKTAYYAEFENKGPGANTAKRVTWPAIKKLSPKDAESFTPGRLFVNADVWIPNTGVPFAAGTFSAN